LHAQSFDIIPLEIASKRNILAVFSPPVSAYKQPLTLLVKYKNRELIDAFDDRINIDLIKRTIFEGESSRKSILHMAIDLLSEKKIRILISKALTYIKSVLSSIFPYMLRTFFLSLFKGFRSDYHTGSGKVIIKDHHFISHTLVSYLYMIFGRLHYFKISTPILPKEKFVYMSLHMEPEAVLVNSSLNQQLYLAEMLANSLPAGWKLLVKEHPHQFKLSMSHMYYFLVNLPLMKWFGSYKRLSSIENISLLSVSVNSETVLKKASAVFTVAGSVALEAVVERVPVMCPTGSFYIRLSPSIREISCQEDIREFLLALDSTDKTEQTTNSDSLAYRKMILNDSGGFGTEIISRALHRELEV